MRQGGAFGMMTFEEQMAMIQQKMDEAHEQAMRDAAMIQQKMDEAHEQAMRDAAMIRQMTEEFQMMAASYMNR